ncbi:MAG: hypothetical protein ABIF92_00875, partial [archaeon]
MTEKQKKDLKTPGKKKESRESVIVTAEKTDLIPVDKLEKERQLIFERLAPLRDQEIILSNIRKDRDNLNFKVKSLSEEVRKKKSERDELNLKVREEKDKRDQINHAASSLRKDFKSSFGDQPGRRGSSELQTLRKMV